MSLKFVLNLAALIALGAMSALADVIELKDAASVSGKILADRRDSVVVDVGYTVLVIPKSSVVKIVHSASCVTSRCHIGGSSKNRGNDGGKMPRSSTQSQSFATSVAQGKYFFPART